MWLLEESVRRTIEEARKTASVTAEQQREHEERHGAAAAERGPRSLRLAGDVAEIRVEGVLTKRPSFLMWLFGLGNTAYSDLLQAIAAAKSNADVKSVRLFVDSPGGEADGLFDVFAALEDLREAKEVRVRAENAYSAAYGIAAVAGPIEAQNHGSMFGSVGVAVRYAKWADVEVFDITNTESPDKRPDPATEHGRAVIRRELDAIFDLFVGAIAKGRGTTKEHVIENFGRGASFVARDAQRRGMIDTVKPPTLRMVAAADPTPHATDENHPAEDGGAPMAHQQKEQSMSEKLDLKTLRAQHPDVYDAAVALGVEQGVETERDRVCAHLELGEQSGDLKTAFAAIRDGSAMTQTLTAKYLAAGMNRSDRQTRQTETDEAGAAVDTAKAQEETTGDLGDQVAALMLESRGKKQEVSHG